MNETYQIILRPLPGYGKIPPIVRLRRFLKTLKRQYGFQCLELRENKPNPRSSVDFFSNF